VIHLLHQASVIYYIRHETESRRKTSRRHRSVGVAYKNVPNPKLHTCRAPITARNFRALYKVALVPLAPYALPLVSASAILVLPITVN
jgi:hypothetical protein